eukprot:1159148-Pelagomonas_calceolata.AAC.22
MLCWSPGVHSHFMTKLPMLPQDPAKQTVVLTKLHPNGKGEEGGAIWPPTSPPTSPHWPPLMGKDKGPSAGCIRGIVMGHQGVPFCRRLKIR